MENAIAKKFEWDQSDYSERAMLEDNAERW